MIVLIDNYDSFVFNLARYFAELGCETRVIRNDAHGVAAIERLRPQAIVLSPGPGTPGDSGICCDVVRELGPHIPILGVCLGHQAIAAAFGARVVRAAVPMHGRTSLVYHNGGLLFRGLPQPLTAMRYHSLVVDEASLSAELAVTARTAEGVVMGIHHRSWPVHGVQFHPESVLTAGGHQLLSNFLTIAGVSGQHVVHGDYRPPISDDDFYSRAIQEHPPRSPRPESPSET
ncbi:MAG: aminodeoxychorismate/anthranilate synthase component II [Planctomycetaceae bacterium]|nr:aminodeoxychorismate/anthranilate synthase component II [Planctomycetaceae bacterium]